MPEEQKNNEITFMPCKIFGVRKEYFDKSKDRINVMNRQIKVFNLLALMLISLTIFSSLSFLVYSLLLFQSWVISIFISLFMAFVVYNLLKLIFTLNLLPKKAHLFDLLIHRDKLFEPYYSKKMQSFSDDEILKIVYQEKHKIREMNNLRLRPFVTSSLFISSLIRVSLLVLLGFIVANGLELFIFKNSINSTLLEMKNSEIFKSDYWMIEKVLTPDKKSPFILINSNSFFLDLKVLSIGLGDLKILIDLFIISLFLIPIIIIHKSKEIMEGEFVKELALSEIAISYYSFLMTKKICENEFLKVKADLEKKYSIAD
jgi:hypothetical protein